MPEQAATSATNTTVNAIRDPTAPYFMAAS
jgi:hypothetical protein